MKKGSWVALVYDKDNIPYQPRLGQILDVYDNETYADIVIYDHEGTKIGRESDPMGGPTKFEPCCELEGWAEIEKPKFPLPRYEYGKQLVLK